MSALLEVVIDRSTRQLVRLAPGGLLEEEYARAVECLRVEIQTGYPELLAEMQEADEAFFGNQQMLRTVLAVGCSSLAARAIKRLRATKVVVVPELTQLEEVKP